MNKVDQLMELVEEYVESSTQSEQDWKFAHQALKAAIEELAKDAARYNWLATYLAGADETHDDALVGCNELEEITEVVDAAMGATP